LPLQVKKGMRKGQKLHWSRVKNKQNYCSLILYDNIFNTMEMDRVFRLSRQVFHSNLQSVPANGGISETELQLCTSTSFQIHYWLNSISWWRIIFATGIMHNNSLTIKIPINYIQKFSPYLMNNTIHVHYEDQSVTPASKNNWCWVWQSNETFIHTQCGQNMAFVNVTAGMYIMSISIWMVK